jgi:hypothetical protein
VIEEYRAWSQSMGQAGKDYDEAVRLAASCPALKYGGRIDLRRVDLVD